LATTAVKAAGAIAAAWIAANLAQTLINIGKESTLLAARFETMGVVLENLAPRAGFTTAEMRKLELALRDTGISMLGVREIIPLLIAAQIDLAHATELARIAQDGAVIAGTDSTEAYRRLVNAITTGNVESLRALNLFVDFDAALSDMAQQLGTTVGDLTELDRVQARANGVMAAGGQIAGTYEAAMETAGKQIGSLRGDFEDFKVTLGLFSQEMLSGAVPAIRSMTEAMTESMQRSFDLEDANLELGRVFAIQALQMNLTGTEMIAFHQRVRDLAAGYAEMAEMAKKGGEEIGDTTRRAKGFEGIYAATLAVVGAEDATKTLDGVLARLEAIQRGATARVLVQQFHEQQQQPIWGPGVQAPQQAPGVVKLEQLVEGGQFQGGGVVPGPVGAPRRAIVHGGEVITDPQFGQQPAGGGPMIGTINIQREIDEQVLVRKLETALRRR
jgi:hypothetical protein